MVTKIINAAWSIEFTTVTWNRRTQRSAMISHCHIQICGRGASIAKIPPDIQRTCTFMHEAAKLIESWWLRPSHPLYNSYIYILIYIIIFIYIYIICILHTYITLHYITLHYITLHIHYITLHHITSHYITLHYKYITSHYITLHYITYTSLGITMPTGMDFLNHQALRLHFSRWAINKIPCLIDCYIKKKKLPGLLGTMITHGETYQLTIVLSGKRLHNYGKSPFNR